MKIVVCVKQVPGTTEARIDPETKRIVREGIAVATNPFDTYAVEEAVKIKEKVGGEVIALSMGPPRAEAVLREAISVGADRGVLLSDRAFGGSDTWATSYALAMAIRKLGDVDLVICGKQAIDGDTAQVGPGIAAQLGWVQATCVMEVREVEAGVGDGAGVGGRAGDGAGAEDEALGGGAGVGAGTEDEARGSGAGEGGAGAEDGALWGRTLKGSARGDCSAGRMVVRRMHEDGHDVCEVPLPAVLTVVKDINQPRVPTLRGRLSAGKREIPVWGAADIGADTALIGLSGSPTRVVKTSPPPAREGARLVLDGTARESARALVHELRLRSLA